MARQASAAYLKGPRKAPRALPKEGTKHRNLHDWLFLHALGKPAEVHPEGMGFSRNALNAALEVLRVYYGLDVRTVGNGGPHRSRPMQVILAGEWDGRAYIDYVTSRNGAPTQ